MSRSSKGLSARLAAAALCAALAVTLALTAHAAPATINYDAKGSLIIQPTYGGTVRSGGVFKIYRVATPDAAARPNLRFAMEPVFAPSGIDVNTLTKNADVEAAANTLLAYAPGVAPEDVITLDRASDGDTVEGLALGVYLIEMVSTPSDYTAASPILVALPAMNPQSGGWLYSVTAQPKMGGPKETPTTVSVSVTKVWRDAGYEGARPGSVSVTLYSNGASYETVTLTTGNWSHTWNGLNGDEVWTVREDAVPAGYTATVTATGNAFTITNARGGTTTEPTEPTNLTQPDEEIGTTDPLGDLTTAPADPDAPVGDEEIGLDIPLAGTLQWPVPVLSACGLALITGGIVTGGKRKHGEDGE